MAKHGKKKWIVAYDGKIKRSNDRTKKDYWKDLKDWHPMEGYRGRFNKGDEHCPQCKHVAKPIVAEHKVCADAWDLLRDEYNAKYGEAEKAWEKYRRSYWHWVRDGVGYYSALRPRVPEPPERYRWLNEQHRLRNFPKRWDYDTRSYLCYKCERKYEMQNRMWYEDLPGKKARCNWSVKNNRKEYRHKVRNIMQRAKYDEEYYDDIPPYTHDWLD